MSDNLPVYLPVLRAAARIIREGTNLTLVRLPPDVWQPGRTVTTDGRTLPVRFPTIQKPIASGGGWIPKLILDLECDLDPYCDPRLTEAEGRELLTSCADVFRLTPGDWQYESGDRAWLLSYGEAANKEHFTSTGGTISAAPCVPHGRASGPVRSILGIARMPYYRLTQQGWAAISAGDTTHAGGNPPGRPATYDPADHEKLVAQWQAAHRADERLTRSAFAIKNGLPPDAVHKAQRDLASYRQRTKRPRRLRIK